MADSSSYGTDLSCVYDLDPGAAEVSGNRLLAEAVARRLITPRGRLIDDPEYGTDVAAYLKAELTPRDVAALASAVRAECKKDQRVADARVRIDAPKKSGRYSIIIELIGADGPFTMTVGASSGDLTLALLTVE